MNSAGILELPCVKQTPLKPDAAPLKDDAAVAPFGDLLARAKGEAKPDAGTDSDDAPAEDATQTAPPPKNKTDDDASTLVPLICVCPPPEIQIPQAPAAAVESVDSGEEPIEILQALPPAPGPNVASSPIPDDTQRDVTAAPDKPLTETVSSKISASSSKTKATSIPASQSKEAKITLSSDLFEPVADATIQLKAAKQAAKAAEPQQPAPPNPTRGTPAAQQENRVKNSGKQAENATATEQKMPVRVSARRYVPEVLRTQDIGSSTESPRILDIDFKTDLTADIAPVKSAQAVHLVESIRTEVANLRVRGDASVSVVLKPDNGTQLTVDVSIARDGTIQARAHCERGDYQRLQADWPQLQQSLAAHGIQVANLSNSSSPQNQNSHQNSAGVQGFQNFDRGQNQQQRDQRETATFEQEIAAAAKPRFSKPQQTSPAVPATRRWQSWA